VAAGPARVFCPFVRQPSAPPGRPESSASLSGEPLSLAGLNQMEVMQGVKHRGVLTHVLEALGRFVCGKSVAVPARATRPETARLRATVSPSFTDAPSAAVRTPASMRAKAPAPCGQKTL